MLLDTIMFTVFVYSIKIFIIALKPLFFILGVVIAFTKHMAQFIVGALFMGAVWFSCEEREWLKRNTEPFIYRDDEW